MKEFPDPIAFPSYLRRRFLNSKREMASSNIIYLLFFEFVFLPVCMCGVLFSWFCRDVNAKFGVLQDDRGDDWIRARGSEDQLRDDISIYIYIYFFFLFVLCGIYTVLALFCCEGWFSPFCHVLCHRVYVRTRED